MAVLALAIAVSVGAFLAQGPAEFTRWVGWATVAAVPLAAAGVLLLLQDKIRASLTKSGINGTDGEIASDSPGPLDPGRSEHTLPLRNPTFTGREEWLAGLTQRLEVGPVAVLALRGLGGVGKSQLALEHAHRMLRRGRYRVVGWVRADSLVTIAEDMAALAPLLALPTEERETAREIAARVVEVLGTQRNWLLVFDNAERAGDLVGMLPGGNGHVLITSRNRTWSGIASQIDLDEFSIGESVQFLCERTGLGDPEGAAELATELGNLPLALAQAAAYIDARSMTIGGYLELYRDPELARRLRDVGLDSVEYPASVARTWLLNFTQLSNQYPAAVELLRLCAFLDPDDIDLDLLSAARAETSKLLTAVLGSKLERAEVAGALAATSLVTVPAEGHLRVHRLVQAVTRDQLDDRRAVQWADRALNMAQVALPADAVDYRSWPAYASWAPHVQAAIGLATSYSIPADRMTLLRNVGVYLLESSQTDAARAWFQRVLAISESFRGPEDVEVAKDLDNLAAAQLRLGETEEACTTIRGVLPILEQVYGHDHPEFAMSLHNLGVAQMQLGQLRQARANFERALAILEGTHGDEHPSLLKCLNNLAGVDVRLRRLRDAHASAERAVNIVEATYGAEHGTMAEFLGLIAVIQMRRLRVRDAISSSMRALSIAKEAYGPNAAIVLLPFVNPHSWWRRKFVKFLRLLLMNDATRKPDRER